MAARQEAAGTCAARVHLLSAEGSPVPLSPAQEAGGGGGGPPQDGAFHHAAGADAVELHGPLDRLRHAGAVARVGEQRGDRRARRARGGHVEQILVHLQVQLYTYTVRSPEWVQCGCSVGAARVQRSTSARDLLQVSLSVNFPLSKAAHSARQTAG